MSEYQWKWRWQLWKTSDLYGEWANIANGLSDPLTVKEAFSSPEKAEWRKAIEKEKESLHTNEVWDLVEQLSRRKLSVASGFSNENNVDLSVERHKAMLVAQSFNQKSGVDYDQTFCPVVRFESVRTIIALAAKYDLKLHQSDITTIFLNGELKEDIYIKQPEGFMMKGK